MSLLSLGSNLALGISVKQVVASLKTSSVKPIWDKTKSKGKRAHTKSLA